LRSEPLGEGAQGVVLRCSNHPALVVKLTRAQNLKEQLERVRTFDLPEDLPLARPLDLVTDPSGGPWQGYVMQLLRDMQPISVLLAQDMEGYIQTGGLKRRLRLLARLARALMQLHQMPLAYADISWNNIFVSSEPGSHEVWLIDADNLAYDSLQSVGIYTPGFGAPEVVRMVHGLPGGRGASSLSDVYAFARLSFHVLGLCDPFHGAAAVSAGWSQHSAQADQLSFEDQVELGQVPWILDPENKSNAQESGLPGEFFLTPQLEALYQQTFGAGRVDRTARPCMGRWYRALLEACQRTTTCQSCGLSHYLSHTCPNCDAPTTADVLAIHAYSWEPGLYDPESQREFFSPLGRHALDLSGEGFGALPRGWTRPSLALEAEEPEVEVRLLKGLLRLRALREGFTLQQGSRGIELPLERWLDCPDPTREQPMQLHCGPMDDHHRVLQMTLHRGGR
jgi:DNA-binding helix-hairpin-helix protein with protein kinase domain